MKTNIKHNDTKLEIPHLSLLLFFIKDCVLQCLKIIQRAFGSGFMFG